MGAVQPMQNDQTTQAFYAAADRFIWSVYEIGSHLDDIRQIWAELMDISQPQWLILMAIKELDQGIGVSGIDIAGKLHVHPTFIANRTKDLEKAGLLAR